MVPSIYPRVAGASELSCFSRAPIPWFGTESTEEILAELRLGEVQPTLALELEEPPLPILEGDEALLFGLLSDTPVPIDDLILESALPAGKVSATLALLEIRGLVRRLPGGDGVSRAW